MSKSDLVVERDILAFTMSRVFDAPRQLVWKVYTDPAFVPRWWGLRNTTTVVDKMDVTVGGTWRFIERDADGNAYAFNGVYKEVVAPERLTYTFEFEPMAGHIVTDALTFEELPDGTTLVTARSTFETLEDLEGMLQSGMEGGANESWDQLAELLVEFQTEEQR